MGGWRSVLVSTIKRGVVAAMHHPGARMLARMIAEEREMYLSSDATRRLGDTVARDLGTTVRRGPFAGLTYPSMAARGSSLVPKLLGSYELELHEAVEEVVRRAPSLIVNIGAGEGYYAVGLARRLPTTRVLAFEADPAGGELIRRMAASNGVADRVEVRGFCHREDLAALPLGPNSLVLCDCEGGEYYLLDPVHVPALARCDLLVEVHRSHGMDAEGHWERVFGATHDLTMLHVQSRDADGWPELARLSYEDRRWLVYERSESTVGWLVARAKAGLATGTSESSAVPEPAALTRTGAS